MEQMNEMAKAVFFICYIFKKEAIIMAKEAKTFLVSTADFALFYNDQLAATGTTNLNTSIEVSMEEQNVNAGKGNKKVYSYKYGRELAVTLETANWDLRYIAANVGTEISEGLADAYVIGACATVNNGIAVLAKTPIGKVAVDLGNGNIVEVDATGATIDLTSYGLTTGTTTVNVTYRYSDTAKMLIIDAETSPKVFKLVLDADKHNNKVGKIGSIQIVIPSYQPSGNFNIEFTPDGVSSTNIDGSALAVEGDTCEAGNSVYAYINEFDDTATVTSVISLAAIPSSISLVEGSKTTLSVIGIKGGLYSNVQLNNADCTFTSGDSNVATVTSTGEVTAVGAGTTSITVTYNNIVDTVVVTVTAS